MDKHIKMSPKKLLFGLFLLIGTIISINGYGKSSIEQGTVDSLQWYSKQLSGKWKLVAYYKDNQLVDTVIGSTIVIEMYLGEQFGFYEYHSDYDSTKVNLPKGTCPSYPKVSYRFGKYVFTLMSLGDESYTDFKLEGDVLMLGDKHDIVKKLVRMKKN